MTKLTPQEAQAVQANLFPEAWKVVREIEDFPWHRDRSGAVTAAVPESSQALAIDVFGTLKTLAAPSRLVDAWISQWGLTFSGPWRFCLEYLVPRAILGEPHSTQVDAVAQSDKNLIFFECKFTEPDGGACSQPQPLGGKSPNRGKVQCTGDYTLQTNPVNGRTSRCALNGKGVRYWEIVPRVLSIANDVDHRPCPFKGGWYQWMRNLVACSAVSESSNKRGAFVVLYADGPFPMAEKIQSTEWKEIRNLTSGREVPLIDVSYQKLLTIGAAAADPVDLSVMQRLVAWVNQKVATVAALPNSRIFEAAHDRELM